MAATVCLHSYSTQLFLEEERERELEALYDAGITESLNRIELPVGDQATGNMAEVTVVAKQTIETLTSGERIIEALDLADTERAAMKEYEESKAKLSENDALRLQPPARNPVLAAHDLEPDEYVLRVIERIPSTTLQDALLVLPFDKVVSLMNYLNLWAEKVG